jgi:hypothetical protein
VRLVFKSAAVRARNSQKSPERLKGRLEIGKPAPMVPTYLVMSGKKSARSPPAEIFNSKKHAKTHEPPF